MEVKRNNNDNVVVGRSSESLEENIENYVKTHDVTFKLPVIGSVTLGARNLDSDELDLKLDFKSDNEVQGIVSNCCQFF